MSEQVKQNIAITALGASTSCGGNAEQSAAAIRAGIVRITLHGGYECEPDDPEWEEELPLYVSTVPLIEESVEGAERFYQLILPVLEQVLNQTKLKRKNLSRCGFLLALPPIDRATANIGLGKRFFIELCKRSALSTLNTGKINQSGSSGMFEHIGEAMELLQTGKLDYCIVGGVDTWLLDDRLDELDAAMRIKSERNRDGFVPGEAATMVMLERLDFAKSRGATIMSIVNGYGLGEEAENFASKKNSTGQGLTNAVRTVLASVNNKAFKTIYCDLNGESYYAVESGVVLSRLGRSLQNTTLIHPAFNCGDVGAATGGLLLACASMSHYRAFDSGEDVLLWTASDNGKRAALSLQQGDIKKLP